MSVKRHFHCKVIIVLFLLLDLAQSKACSTTNELTCADGTCISIDKVCDNTLNCPSGEDEINCIGTNCPEGLHKCPDGTCKYHQNDCRRTQQCNPTNEFTCSDGKCISVDKRCDGYFECAGREDEINCTTKQCPEGLHNCLDGSCKRDPNDCVVTTEKTSVTIFDSTKSGIQPAEKNYD